MTITFNGIKENGEHFSKEISEKETNLNLSDNQLVSVDLSPLENFSTLEELDFEYNKLVSMDITLLQNCQRLKKLYLGSNQLATIDLTALKNSKKLQKLSLDDNQIALIDLTPLKNCSKLQVLTLDSNQLDSVDLSPLKNCPKLRVLTLDDNVILYWRDKNLLAKTLLPKGLRGYYSRLKLIAPVRREEHKPFAAAMSLNDRQANLMKVIENYSKISLEVMAELLGFETVIDLQKWILNQPGKKSFYIEGSEVIIPKELKTANISEMVKSFDTAKHFTCYYCGLPTSSKAIKCPDCHKELLKCSVCKLPINFGDDVGYCTLCEAKGHLSHMEEWVKTQGKCPQCMQKIPTEGILPFETTDGKKNK